MVEKTAQGQIVVFHGDGKGKTTAGLGTVIRALGHGQKVGVVQFIKGKWKTGERLYCEALPELEFFVMGRGFTWDSDDISRDKAAAKAAWEKSDEMLCSGAFDLVVLDEISYAVNYGFLDGAEINRTLQERSSHTHVVLTGRNMPESILDIADTVTEMLAVKHAHKKGVPAQKGLDF